MRWLAAVLVVAVLPLAPGASAQGDLCAAFEPVEVGGTLGEPRVIELSGLAASRRHTGVLWAHNDSGGAAELYALGDDGAALGAFPVEGATATDWEDMASGPGPDGEGAFLYVGDIGDNDAARPSVTVYRVPEPEGAPVAPGAPLTGAEAIELVYPDGPADAEALLVDPVTGDLVIVTKSFLGASRVLRVAAADLDPGAPVTPVDEGALRVPLPPDPGPGLPGTAVTGGDVAPDGSVVLLRTYRSVLAFPRSGEETVAEALLGEPCFAPQAEETQGEAVAFTTDGAAYVTVGEGSSVPVHRVALTAPLTSTTSEPTDPPTDDRPTDDQPTDDRADDDSATATVLVVAAVALLAVGLGAVLWARRRRASAG